MNPPAIHPGVRIGHVHLKVADLERALAFYHGVLGFEITQRMGRQAAFLSAGGYHHHLGTNTWAGPGAEPPAADDARLLEWTVQVPAALDVAAVERSLVLGGHVTERTSPQAIVARDPWGTAVRVEAVE